MEHFSSEFPVRAYEGDTAQGRRKRTIAEAACTIVVDRREWVTLLCTPTALDDLAIGFLFDAGVIQRFDDLAELAVTDGPEGMGALVEVRLARPDVALPERPTLTSGCSGGITFFDLAAKRTPLLSTMTVSPHQVYHAMEQLMAANLELHRDVGGFHTSGLSDGKDLLLVAHDVGRHNTLDKIAGAALRRGIATRDRLLVTTGRVSAEMLAKASRLQAPIIISRNSPTGLATHLAREWRLTVIGYVRNRKMQVFTGEERIAGRVPQATTARGRE